MAFPPDAAALAMIKRAEGLLSLATTLTKKDQEAVRDDLLRLAIVMAVAALDTYMHRLIVSRAYEEKVLPESLANVTIGFGDLIRQAEVAVKARSGGRNARLKVSAKRLLRERLRRDTFQRHEQVSDALAMAGKSGEWKQIAAAMPDSLSPADVKKKLNALVDQRNAIAHEGDYKRLDRPQRAMLNEIKFQETQNSVKFVSDLIHAIHDVIRPA